jgi:hypothetical protein
LGITARAIGGANARFSGQRRPSVGSGAVCLRR